MYEMIIGAIATTCFCASLFFLRFWKTTRDRFFIYFAASFGIEGINRVLQGMLDSQDEREPIIYVIRLISFLIILFAIVDKNWRKKKDEITDQGT